MFKEELKELFDSLPNISEKTYFNRCMVGKLGTEEDTIVKISFPEKRSDHYEYIVDGCIVDIINKTTGRINFNFFKFLDYKKESKNNHPSSSYIYVTCRETKGYAWHEKLNDTEKECLLSEIEQYLNFFEGK